MQSPARQSAGLCYSWPVLLLAVMNIRDLIEVDLEKMSGTPCFTGTRVPVAHLFDYLEAGDSLDEFLTDFPTVTREQVLGVLELMRNRILTEYETAA